MSTRTDRLIDWLLEGDVSIQYQVHRDLLAADETVLAPLQRRMESEGWGAKFLAMQNPDGHWGRGFYQPKWTCTHYTLLDLHCLGLPRDNPQAGRAVQMMFDTSATPDGSINFATTNLPSDVCINGMALGYAAKGGKWNDGRRENVIHQAEARAMEFILRHQLFMSDHTGEVIKPQFLMLSYPSRWYYDILRALDYCQAAGVGYDERMAPALSVLVKKRRADGTWPLQAKHPGQVHFDMEETGGPSRWNTLRALRVIRKYG